MWISKRDYEELQNKCDTCSYKATERVIIEPLCVIYTNDAVIMSRAVYLEFCEEKMNMDNERKVMQEQIKKYQMMYADEVQKRLTLIEQLGK